MIKNNRWNTEDFVFEDEPIIKTRPRRNEGSSWGVLLRMIVLPALAFIFFAIFCVGLATILLYFGKN
jgi:hypothetical protein